MADECDLEELTAFLEASDNEDEIDHQEQKTVENTDVPVDIKPEKAFEGNDDCSLEEIEAFLQGSDDESDSSDELDKPDINADSNKDNIDTKCDEHKEEEFDDMDEGEMEHIEQMMESEELTNRGGNQSTVVSENPSTNGKTSTNDAVDKDKTDQVAVGDVDTDSIKAEMAAMAERMKQLERMLQSKSNSSSNESKSYDPDNRQKQRSVSINNSVNQSSDKSSSVHSERKASHKSPSSHSEKKSSHKSPSSSSDRKLSHKSSSSHSEKKSSHKSPSSHSEKKSSHRSPSSSSDRKLSHKSSSDNLERKSSHKSPSSNKVRQSSSAETVKVKEKTDKESYSNKSAGAMAAHKHSKSSHREHEVPDKTLENNIKTEFKNASNNAETDDDENPFFANNKQADELDMKMESEVSSKSLFGDSDDSDWDDLGGEEKHELSKEGKDLKKLILSGQRKREAHTASYDTAVLKKPNLSRWSDKPLSPITLHGNSPLSGHAASNRSFQQQLHPQKPALNPETGTVSGKYKLKEEYMTKSMLSKEDERESVTDPFCGIRIINPRISMSEFKLKMDGRNMMKIPRLLSRYNKADLQKDNWVTLGVVVHKTEPRQSAAGKTYCIWKLSDLQDCDKTVTFFLFGNVYKEHWKNDLGVVIGLLNPSFMDKAEKSQSEVAMTIQHPQQLLMLGISKDLGRCRSTTKSGQPCSSFINKQQGEFCTYHVQSAYRKSSSKRSELQASTGVQPKAFAAKKLNSNKKDGFFFYGGNTYTTMKPQAKSSKDTMTLKKLQSYEARKPSGKITTMSLHELEADDEKKINKLAEKDKQLLSLLSVPSAGSMNFVKHLVKKDATKSFVNNSDGSTEAPSATAKDLLKEHTKTILQKKRETALLSSTPTIGKGFTCGQVISLDAHVKKKTGSASAEFAKQLAIAKIKAKGGLKAEDPNAVRKKVISPEAKEKIRKRVAEDMDPSPSKESGSKEPPKKKSKLLGDLDLNSPEVQKLLKKKSKHTGALAEAEAEHEERYFSALEKKEKMEDKMSSIMEVSVKLVYCVQCKYKYTSAHERCKKENHTLKYFNGVKRFYRCKHCKKHTFCFDRMPTSACEQCGNMNYERTSMHREKKGPTLESEELCLRGNEQKFLGSLQGKPNFNG